MPDRFIIACALAMVLLLSATFVGVYHLGKWLEFPSERQTAERPQILEVTPAGPLLEQLRVRSEQREKMCCLYDPETGERIEIEVTPTSVAR